MTTANELREKYLEYFVQRDHARVASSPIVPPDDPTMLFTSAGMVQFKPLYAGVISPLPYARATTCQKCLRAGGKASDLENVGKTLRHHTFFEMLGNFSFGDYFKREALEWGWDFVWNVMKLPKDRLWGTTFIEDDETPEILEKEKINAYLFDGYWEDIGTIKSFYDANIQLTDINPKLDRKSVV